jgi:hypothetical protein
MPDFRYFQSWSPNKKCVPWYKNMMFNKTNVVMKERKNGVLAFFISEDMWLFMLKFKIFSIIFVMVLG